MEIKLNQSDRFRVVCDHEKDNFIDIGQIGFEAMYVDLYTRFQYIEIRKKECVMRVFLFKKKSHKKECDFGWWADADVVYSINQQVVNKE